MSLTINKQLFKDYMHRNRLTLSALAAKSGVDKSTLSRFLSGEFSLKTTTLNKLLTVMDLKRDQLNLVFTHKKEATGD